MMNITSVEEFDSLLTETHTPVVVKFTAPWCGPCKQLTPLLEEVAEQYIGSALFVSINVDDFSELAQRHNVRSVPTLMVFNRGVMISSKPGLCSKEILSSWIATNI